MLTLLVFAHRGEAQAFLKSYAMKSTPLFGGGVFYEGENLGLLLTGEGPWKALERSSFVLGHLASLGRKPDLLVNLGVAGAWQEELPLEEVYPIRTVYGFWEKMLFQSYTCSPWEQQEEDQTLPPEKDLLTLGQRGGLPPPLPSLLDREGWALARAASLAQVKLSMVKIISDQGKNPDCDEIRQKAPLYSQKLLDFFEKYRPQEAEQDHPLNLQGFYFTQSQRRALTSLLKHLPPGTFKKLPLEQFKNDSPSPKKASQNLIHYLESLLNPLSTSLHEKLDALVGPHCQEKITFHRKKDLERLEFSVRLKIQEKEDIPSLKRYFQEFPFEKFLEIYQGKHPHV